jgi:hypothetical protein
VLPQKVQTAVARMPIHKPWHVIAELKQQMADLQKQLDDRPTQVPRASRPQVRVSPKDIALVKFSGNDNMDAHLCLQKNIYPC